MGTKMFFGAPICGFFEFIAITYLQITYKCNLHLCAFCVKRFKKIFQTVKLIEIIEDYGKVKNVKRFY